MQRQTRLGKAMMGGPASLETMGSAAPGLLAQRARREPRGVAFRSKHLGLYRERTWSDYADLVARCARGLEDQGLRGGGRVAILGDPCEEWAICDLAAQALGAISYGIYPTAPSSEVEHLLRDGGANICVAETQEFVDKILPLLDRLPALETVVVISATTLFASKHPKLVGFDRILTRGGEQLRAAGESGIESLERLSAAIDPEAPAFIGYTAGTTGKPKGVQVSHGASLVAARAYLQHYPLLGRSGHRTVAHLPPCHPLGRQAAITLPLISDIVPHFGGRSEDLPQTLFEVAPTVLVTVPRYLERFAAQILLGIAGTTSIKRRAHQAAVAFGRRVAQKRWERSATWFDRALYGAVHWVTLRPILNKLGLDQVQLVISGGAPLAPETGTLWQVYGVNVVEIYSQTETVGAPITGQLSPFPQPGNAGVAVSDREVSLGSGDEILVRVGDLFTGYWQDAPATAAALGEDGWLHTGDVGAWENGALHILDRDSDRIAAPDGARLSLSRIEGVLRLSPFISEVVVFGAAGGQLTALVEIEYEAVAHWARCRNIAFTGYASLAARTEVAELIGSEFDEARARSSGLAQIAAFHLLPEPLDPGEERGAITPTRKVKRTLLAERFREWLDAPGNTAGQPTAP
ncbi:MAG: AMP-binding protein [Deferrisomatales bacterium]|nr:AMP-binding protein [Deferrisomatales bacterium]